MMWGINLGRLGLVKSAVAAVRRRAAARELRRARAGVGEQEREGKAAGELPYPAVKLWRRLAAAEGRRNDGAAAARGAGGNGAAEGACGCGLELGHGWRRLK
jgi:hypothetical protein